MANAKEKETAAKTQTRMPEKYFWVTFSERTEKDQTEDVFLGVNGQHIICKRGEKLILPESYVKVAQDAVIHEMYPDGDKFVDKKILRYPCTIHGEASKADYLKMLAEGTRATKEMLKGTSGKG